ncbi:sigma-70 family RNA polymerase sigma factor [Novilysobacter erysipheiresistens]|uniref:RNA polymerase sigma factor n=1 Tax=Novilysobacter erysipheiresistens TaxID=1749332 RepID=A0ABU7YXS7_9GAMM
MTDISALQSDASASDVDALLTRVARGDQPAFESLYRSTSGKLLGICLRVLSDRAEAEDVLQDVYVTVWNKAGQFDASRARASTWLGTIARNRSIDRLRALPAPASRAPIEIAETARDPAPSPVSQAEAANDASRLDDCLEQLEPRRQTLIRTAFFDGATYEELATRSGSPLGSIKSWIRRGLMQLKACLEQ